MQWVVYANSTLPVHEGMMTATIRSFMADCGECEPIALRLTGPRSQVRPELVRVRGCRADDARRCLVCEIGFVGLIASRRVGTAHP